MCIWGYAFNYTSPIEKELDYIGYLLLLIYIHVGVPWPQAVNNNDKELEPKTTSFDCDIGMNVSQNGSVSGHDKAAETKAATVDSEIGTKLTRMGTHLQ